MNIIALRALSVSISLTALLLAVPGAAETAAPSAPVLKFDRFVRSSSPLCAKRPAAHCVDAGWDYADVSRDGGLSLAELKAIQEALTDWTVWRYDNLSGRERASIAMGLWLVNAVGLERLMASFDADGNGMISRSELLADVSLDERPLGEVLLDPEAVDRKAVAQRFGSMAPLLDGVFSE